MDDKSIQFKDMFFTRFIRATLVSIILQYVCINFAFFMRNLSLFQPIEWIWSAVTAMFTIYSLFLAIPIAIMVFLNGYWIVEPWAHAVPKGKVWLNKCQKYGVRTITGVFLTWMFLLCVHENNNKKWIPYLWYLNGLGYTVFMQYKWRDSLKMHSVQQLKVVRIKDGTIDVLYSGLCEALKPSIIASLIQIGYILFRYRDFGFTYSIELLFMCWVLCSYINSSFRLMQLINRIYFTDVTQFSLNKDGPFALADALACAEVPMIQKLAALDFYRLSENYCINRRRVLFDLSVIGGHPVNWRKMHDTTTTVLKEFMSNLNQIIDTKSKPVKESWPILYEVSDQKKVVPTLRQRNEERGIRSLASPVKTTVPLKEQKQISTFEIPALTRFTQYIKRWTEESKEEKVFKLLVRDYQTISWICRGLAGIVEHSLVEDKYGVVQDNLANILTILFELQQAVEKINALSLVKVKTSTRYTTLRNGTRHSLFRLTKVLRPYLEHIRGLDQEVALQARDYHSDGYAR